MESIDIEAGKRCPRGQHLSYRTKSGAIRKSGPKCVKHRSYRKGGKVHRRSAVPKSIRYMAGKVSSPGRLRAQSRCRPGYHRSKSGKRCVQNMAGGAIEQLSGGAFEQPMEQQPLAGGWWFQSATEAPAATSTDAVVAVEGGKNKRCPPGKHRSWRTRSGKMRKGGSKCVKHSGSHKSSPKVGAKTHCRKGYHKSKTGKSCVRNK